MPKGSKSGYLFNTKASFADGHKPVDPSAKKMARRRSSRAKRPALAARKAAGTTLGPSIRKPAAQQRRAK